MRSLPMSSCWVLPGKKGLVPVGLESLRQAIELNGVAIEANHRAFLLGRVAATHPERLAGAARA